MYKAIHVPHKWLVINDIVDQGSIEAEHAKLTDEIIRTNLNRSSWWSALEIYQRNRKAGLNIYTTLTTWSIKNFLVSLAGQSPTLKDRNILNGRLKNF